MRLIACALPLAWAVWGTMITGVARVTPGSAATCRAVRSGRGVSEAIRLGVFAFTTHASEWKPDTDWLISTLKPAASPASNRVIAKTSPAPAVAMRN